MTAAAAVTTTTVSSGEPSWVLLNFYAKVAETTNETTAHCQLRNEDLKVSASLVRERAPLPSNLHVHCSGAGASSFAEPPSSLAMVDHLILFHAYIGPPSRARCVLTSHFFIYRADPNRPSLNLLSPHCPRGRVMVSRNDPFSIFPRGQDHYTIASLIHDQFSSDDDLLSLRLYDSETSTWTSKKLSVDSPQQDFPVAIPENFHRMLSHRTSTVITLAGEGTIGWVDLWRGVLFCDMRRSESEEQHTLRGVPLPLPFRSCIEGIDADDQGAARPRRGIAFVDGHLRLADLGLEAEVDIPYVYDQETGWPRSRIHNWTITTWINKEMSDSYDDWHVDSTLRASDIDPLGGDHSESSQLLPPIALHNLYVSDPIIGMNENDSHVVYLTAREKFMHPKAWILAIDTRNLKVQSVTLRPGPLPQEMRFIDACYCTCSISKSGV